MREGFKSIEESECEDTPATCDRYYCNFEAKSISDMKHHFQEAHTITSSFVYQTQMKRSSAISTTTVRKNSSFAVHVYNAVKFFWDIFLNGFGVGGWLIGNLRLTFRSECG